MKSIIALIFFSLFLISCQNVAQKAENKIITFDLRRLPKTSEVKLSELGFFEIDYIPLETNEKCLIKRTIKIGTVLSDRIVFGDNYFIIKEYSSILKFKNNGSFISRIGTQGRGPDEFQSCHDLAVNNSNNQIYILDGWKKSIFFYSKNGDFIKTIKIPLYGVGSFKIVDNKFLCYNINTLGDVTNSFSLIDTSGEIIKSFPNRYPFVKPPNDAYGMIQENIFYIFDHKIFKKEVYSDTIYFYKNRVFKPHLVIEVGDRLISPKARSEFSSFDLAKNYISPRNLFEFGDYIYYEFTYKSEFTSNGVHIENYGFIGSKKDNFQAIIIPESGLINDLDGGPNILPLTIKDDNTVVAMIDAQKLKSYIASYEFKNSNPKYPEKKKELEKLANSLKETDNPVLMMVRLKK